MGNATDDGVGERRWVNAIRGRPGVELGGVRERSMGGGGHLAMSEALAGPEDSTESLRTVHPPLNWSYGQTQRWGTCYIFFLGPELDTISRRRRQRQVPHLRF